MHTRAWDAREDATPEQPAIDFARLLSHTGVSRALAFLNARTAHRYTGVYQFDRRTLRCLALFDRENSDVYSAPEEILDHTYCGLIREFSTAFATDDSRADDRLTVHPARNIVRAFHGVPLLDLADRCVGALCHWDVRPQRLDAREMRLLFAVAPIVAMHVLRVHPSRQSRVNVIVDDLAQDDTSPARRSFLSFLPRLMS